MNKGQISAQRNNPLVFIGDDEALAKALRARQMGAREALYDRYAIYVRKVLARTLGTHVDLNDHVHDVFISAFSSIDGIRHDKKLKAWLTSVAIYTAISFIRKQSTRRLFIFRYDNKFPEPRAVPSNYNDQEALRLVFELLDTMPAKFRIPFSLRYMEGMTLPETAEACGVSLATVKRRLRKADQQFVHFIEKYPLLKEYMKEGTRWRDQ